MAKELPYFRFTVQDWQNKDISLESYELKGLFIDVCGFYWINDCNTTLTILKKKFSNATILLDELVKLDIIKHEKKHDKIEIDFLNKQYDLLSEKRKLRQSAGSKGGNAKAMLKQKHSYKDKDKDKDNNKEKDNNNLIEIWFKDLENSQALETICINNKFDINQIRNVKLPEFKKYAELDYPNYNKFVSHFKNWVIKNPPKDLNAPLKMVY
jgi:hypothetical protein